MGGTDLSVTGTGMCWLGGEDSCLTGLPLLWTVASGTLAAIGGALLRLKEHRCQPVFFLL